MGEVRHNDMEEEYYIGNMKTLNSDDYAIIWNEERGYAEITKYSTNNQTENKLKNPEATHYELWKGFEAIDIIKRSLTDEEYKGYLKGNLLKYRLRDKNQDESDKIKAQDYQRELKHINN